MRRPARVNIFGDGGGADEADRLDVGVVENGVHRFLVAVDDIENAGRQAGFDHQLRQPQRHADGRAPRLEDEGVAAGDGRAEFPHRDHRREIERRDAGDDAQRLAHASRCRCPGPAPSVYSPLSRCGMPRQNSATSRPRWMSPLRIGNGLAMLARQQCGQRVHVAIDQFDEFHQHAGAALRIGRGPGGLGRRAHSPPPRALPRRGQRHARNDFAGHGLIGVGEAAGRSLDVLAADEMRQFGRHGFHPCFCCFRSGLCDRAPSALQRPNSPIYCVKIYDRTP